MLAPFQWMSHLSCTAHNRAEPQCSPLPWTHTHTRVKRTSSYTAVLCKTTGLALPRRTKQHFKPSFDQAGMTTGHLFFFNINTNNVGMACTVAPNTHRSFNNQHEWWAGWNHNSLCEHQMKKMTAEQGYLKKPQEAAWKWCRNYSCSHTQRSPGYMLTHACVVLLHFKHMHSCVACDMQ